MAIIFSKFLKQTDIRKRLSVRSKNRKCFLNFGKQQRRAELKAVDEDGRKWEFVCTIRKEGYPKPVLSKGWLQFVHWWSLAIKDQVILHDKQDGEEYYPIQVVKHPSSLTVHHSQSHDHEQVQVQDEPAIAIAIAIAIASHADAVAEAQSISISNSATGSEFGREPHDHAQVRPRVREPQLIDFFALELQQQAQRQREVTNPNPNPNPKRKRSFL